MVIQRSHDHQEIIHARVGTVHGTAIYFEKVPFPTDLPRGGYEVSVPRSVHYPDGMGSGKLHYVPSESGLDNHFYVEILGFVFPPHLILQKVKACYSFASPALASR